MPDFLDKQAVQMLANNKYKYLQFLILKVFYWCLDTVNTLPEFFVLHRLEKVLSHMKLLVDTMQFQILQTS